MRKIKFITGFSLLIFSAATLFAQNNLYVKLNTGIQNQYALASIQNIKAYTGAMLITMNDGTTQTVSSGSLRYFNFVNLTTNLLDKPSNKNVGISLYPNPLLENKLTINYELTNPGAVLIEILDLKGVLVKQMTEKGNGGNNETHLELQGVSSGIYTCRISTSSQTGITKLIKQ